MNSQAADQVLDSDPYPQYFSQLFSCRQNAIGGKGFYVNVHEEKRSMKLGDFKKIAHQQATVGSSSRRSGRDAPTTYSTEVLAELEKKFWRNILFNPPMYGADCPVPKGPADYRPLSLYLTSRTHSYPKRSADCPQRPPPPSLPHRPSLLRAALLPAI